MKNVHTQILIKTIELRVGMYVLMPSSWLSHPFIKNEILISSDEQIKKILESGFTEVIVDKQKSTINFTEDSCPQANESIGNKSAGKIVSDELLEIACDKTLSPHKKAKALHKQAVLMISKLMDAPNEENIIEAKKGIAEIVDLILSDDETSYFLLSITSHDHYTYTHSVNVGILGVSLSKSIFRKSSAHDMHELGAAFFLHDLGKVNVDKAIINKPGKLSEQEMDEMKKHPENGYSILNSANQLTEECKEIVLQHHERYDGKGYPRGISENDIHIYGRICSVADVYDALTTDRPYRKKMDPFSALKLMKEEMITHFHKDIFDQFVLLFRKGA